MSSMLQKIHYDQLNSRQKENFNFQKAAARLADYGFNCMKLSDDWQGADFIACHIDGKNFIKVQLKGRLTIDKKYSGKNIYITFNENNKCYIYPHDVVQDELLNLGVMIRSKSWNQNGNYHWPNIPKHMLLYMEKYSV